MKTVKQMIWLGSLFVLIVASTDASADWQRRTEDLPGITTGEELVVPAVIAGAGLLIALLIPSPDPAIHVRQRDLLNRDGTPAEGQPETVSRFEQFSKPSVVDRKSRGKDLYGIVRPSGDGGFVVETEDSQTVVAYANVKEIMDLESKGKRRKMSSVKLGIVMSALSVMSFYAGSTMTDDLEEDSAMIQNILGVSFGALAVFCFIHQPGEEKAYKTWERAHQEAPPAERIKQRDDEIAPEERDETRNTPPAEPTGSHAPTGIRFGFSYGGAPVMQNLSFGARENSVWLTLQYAF